MILAEESDDLVMRAIDRCSKEKAFGNARGIRNMVDRIVENRAVRIAARLTAGEDLSVDSLRRITDEDIRFLIEN